MPTGISPGGRPINESPLSTSKTDNWVARNGGLPPYIRGIARGIAKKHGGKVTSSDIKIARGSVAKLALKSKHPAVKAAAAAAMAQWAALRAKSHVKNLAYPEGYQLLDLAASAGHHIKGTSYHWKHNWIPRDLDTAKAYHKKFTPGSLDPGYFNVEPEEFNGVKGTPKFIGSVPGGAQPKMKYHKDKILTGKHLMPKNSMAKHHKSHVVAGVSESKTHEIDTEGNKHDLNTVVGVGKADNEALQAFKKKKFAPAIKEYKIQSDYKPAKQGQHLKTHHVAKNQVYNAPADEYGEPTFNASTPLADVNVSKPLTVDERQALMGYTGSAYSPINYALRNNTAWGSQARNIKLLDSAIAKATPLQGHPILHRGVSVAALADLQPGDSFTDKGFSSTSRSANIGATRKTTRIHIESMDPKMKALDLSSLSLFQHEQEVLLPRNTTYTVTKRVNHGNHSHLYVHVAPATAKALK